jgi:mannose-6-phosphate isomerase-like protein (cupin superfamily)
MTAFVEPTSEDQPSGYLTYKRVHSPYEKWIEEEGIPVFKGIGVSDTRELTLGDWKRRNARGTYLLLAGVEDVKGLYVIEVPGGGVTNPEKHMYDEFFYVVEGRGSTEIWRGDGKPTVFEWQPGSLFMIPVNASYRLVNATGGNALLIASNNAPPVLNLYQSRRFVFENDWDFAERYDISGDFFKANAEISLEPVRGRAAVKSNIFPDIKNAELPLDNQRAPGYRRIQPSFAGFVEQAHSGGFVAQYPSGRYSKAHFHSSGAVLVCLRGAGYTINWPTSAGTTPFKDGKDHLVNRVDYVPGGLVAAAPGGGNWFHQHFGVGAEPLRTLNFWGGPTGRWSTVDDDGGEEVKAGSLFGVHQGGRAILYHEEDPWIRTQFKQRLAEVGVEFTMPEDKFEAPPPAAS